MAIKGYTGGLGSGKTLGMVADAVSMVRRERVQVFTNMVGLKIPEAVYLGDLTGLTRIGEGLVLLDEASVCMASRFWHEVPREVISAFAQARKHGLDLWYTAQHIQRVDTVVREITNEEVYCRRLFGGYIQVEQDPAIKQVIGRRLRRYGREVMACYDTLERIAVDGSGGAVKQFDNYPAPAYRPKDGRGRRKYVGLEVFDRKAWRGNSDGRRWLTPEAEAVKQWLIEQGHLSSEAGTNWTAPVEYELRRRAWLKVFDLTYEEVPWGCTPESPWAEGFSPFEVKQRKEDEEERIAARTVAVRAAGRGGMTPRELAKVGG